MSPVSEDGASKDGASKDGASQEAPAGDQSSTGAIRRWVTFATGGGVAFLVDAGVLMALTRLAGMNPLPARLLAIAAAMVVSWGFHRTFTFPMKAAPTLTEFLRFVALGWAAAALNYAVFAALVLMVPSLHHVLAIAVACLFAMVLSFAGMRFGVFAKSA